MKNIILGIFIVISLSVFTVLPLLRGGFFEFHDNTQVVRVFEMGRSLSYGTIPVRWAWELGYGYGYPIFNFYGPLPYYIGGGVMNLGIDPLSSTKIMFVIGILGSGVGMFLLGRKLYGTLGGILSSIMYVYMPYHAVNIYVRGAVNEFFAYAFLPVVLWGIVRLFEKKRSSILIIAIGIAGVATSHNLSLYMLFILLVPFIFLSVIFVKSKARFLVTVLLALAFGLMLSAFYILPAFLEMGYTNVASQVGGGADFRDHFVCIGQYWNSMWGFGGSVGGCVDGLSFKLGKVNIFLTILALLLILFQMYKKRVGVAEKVTVLSFVMLALSLFLTLPISSFIWETIPYMEYLQYPWRFGNFIAVFMAIIIGYIPYQVFQEKQLKALYIPLIVVGIAIILSNYKLFVPQDYNSYPASYYTRHDYIQYTVSKISDEYLPRGFQKPVSVSSLPSSRIELHKTSGNIGLLESTPTYMKAYYDSYGSGIVHANIAYFPAWHAYIDGVEKTVVKTANGMDIPVQKGGGTVEFKFHQTLLEVVANTISVIALFIVFVSIVLWIIKFPNFPFSSHFGMKKKTSAR